MKQESAFLKILLSKQLAMKVLRVLFVFSLAALGCGTLKAVVESLKPPLLYQRDFLQEYLLAKATLTKVYPYLPLPRLAKLFLPDVQATFLPHPTPHPPPVVLLSLPLALFSYQKASILWFIIELISVSLIWWIMSCWLYLKFDFAAIIVGTLVVVAWHPFLEELIYGQLMIVLLLCLMVCGLLVHLEKPVGAGILLGMVLSLKLLGWPLLIFWAVKKNWPAVAAAIVTVFALNLFSALLVKFNVVLDYYTQVGPAIAPFYRSFAFNFSTWTIGWRFFAGTGSPVLISFESPPLVSIPQIAPYVSLLVSISVLAGGILMAVRARTFEFAFMVLVCLSTLVNPVTWIHYFTWVFPPLVVLARRLLVMGLPLGKTFAGLLVCVILALPSSTLSQCVYTLSGISSPSTEQVPFLASLITLVQPLAVIGLMLLLKAVDQSYKCEAD